MPDFGEKGAQSTAKLDEQSLLSFRGAREQEKQLIAARNIPKGICIDCGKEIEAGRQELDLCRCRECAFKQPSSYYFCARKAAVF